MLHCYGERERASASGSLASAHNSNGITQSPFSSSRCVPRPEGSIVAGGVVRCWRWREYRGTGRTNRGTSNPGHRLQPARGQHRRRQRRLRYSASSAAPGGLTRTVRGSPSPRESCDGKWIEGGGASVPFWGGMLPPTYTVCRGRVLWWPAVPVTSPPPAAAHGAEGRQEFVTLRGAELPPLLVRPSRFHSNGNPRDRTRLFPFSSKRRAACRPFAFASNFCEDPLSLAVDPSRTVAAGFGNVEDRSAWMSGGY